MKKRTRRYLMRLGWMLCLCIGVMLVIAGISLLIVTPHTNVVTVGVNVNQGVSLQMTVTSSVTVTIVRATSPNATESSNSTVTNSTLP